MTLSATDFLKRYLLHVPAAHTKIIRYYGLYASTAAEEVAFCRSLFGEQPIVSEEIEWLPPRTAYPEWCPVCGHPFLHYVDLPHWKEVIPHAT